MNPIQVAQDYAAEEGYDCALSQDGSVEIFHPRGAAKISPDGKVRAYANSLLKSVLERKIAAARLNDARLQEDPSGRCTIKFSSIYQKMPHLQMPQGTLAPQDTRLMAVLKVKHHQLSPEFLEWDTKFADKPGNYPLPAGQEYLVLMLFTSGQLWTTIRAAWPPEKEGYYRSHVGEIVNIEIQGGK
jgi:hypothetical protein